jgi:hypothetical protein
LPSNRHLQFQLLAAVSLELEQAWYSVVRALQSGHPVVNTASKKQRPSLLIME